MLNGKLENSFISGQDKETLRRTRTERQNYEELSKEFRERIVKDLDTKELKSLTQKSGASLLSIQALMKVQGSYLRNIDNNLKKLVKINDNFIKALTKNLSLGTRINLGDKASRLGSYATDNRSNILKDNKEYANLSKNISTFTDVLKELDRKQQDRTNEVLSMLSEVPTDVSTNISLALDKTLRNHPMLRKIYGALSATAGSAFNWSRQGISEMLGLPKSFSLSNLTKIVSWNTTGKWGHEVKINKSLPLQTIISLLSSIQKQTWLINNDTLSNIQNGRKSANREVEDRGGLKKFADSFGPGWKTFFRRNAFLSLLFPGTVGASNLWLAKQAATLGGFFGNIGLSIIQLLGQGLINYPIFGTLGLSGLYTVSKSIYNRARTNAKRKEENEKKLERMRSEAQGNWFNPEYETMRTKDGKNISEKDRSKTYFGYIKEELFSKAIGHSILTKGFGKTISDAWLSIFNQDKLRAEREANDKEAEAKAVENFKNKFIISIAKRGKDVVDSILGLKEMEYDIKLMREQVVGQSNFKEIEEIKKELADQKARQKFAEETKIDKTWYGDFLKFAAEHDIIPDIKNAWNLTGNFIKNDWNATMNDLRNSFEGIRDEFLEKFIEDMMNPNESLPKALLKSFGHGLSTDISRTWGDLKTVLNGTKNVLRTSSGSVIGALGTGLNKGSQNISGFFKDWYGETTQGKDEFSLLSALSSLYLPNLQEKLDKVRKDDKSKGNNFSNIFNQDEQGTFAFGLYQRLGLEPNQTIASKLKDIHNQFYYGQKNANSFASVLFGKIDNINKYLWKVIGTNADKDDTTKLYGIIKQIFTEVGQLKPEPRGHTLKYILNGALSPSLENTPGNIKHTQDIVEGVARVFDIGQPANQNLLIAAKSQGQNIQNGLIKPFTNQTSQDSIFYKLGEDVHKILEILNDNISNKKSKSAWNKPTHYFAEGGVVTGPINAVVGEKGTEAILPLEGSKAKSWIGNLVEEYNNYKISHIQDGVEGQLFTSSFIQDKLSILLKDVLVKPLGEETGTVLGKFGSKMITYATQTALGKTKVGNKLYGFVDKIEGLVDKGKKKLNNMWAFFKDPLKVLLGSADKPAELGLIGSIINKAIFPTLGIGLFILFASSRFKSALGKFFKEMIPNIIGKDFLTGLNDNFQNLADLMPSLGDKLKNPFAGNMSSLLRLYTPAAIGMDVLELKKHFGNLGASLGEGNISESILNGFEGLNALGRTSFAVVINKLTGLPYGIASAVYDKFSSGVADLATGNSENLNEQLNTPWYKTGFKTIGNLYQSVFSGLHGDTDAAKKGFVNALYQSGGWIFGNDWLKSWHKNIDADRRKENEKEMSNLSFVKAKADKYGIDVSTLKGSKDAIELRGAIEKLETPSISEKVSKEELDKLRETVEKHSKFNIAGKNNLSSTTFSKGFTETEEYKKLQERLKYYEGNKFVEYKGILKSGSYSLSGELFRGDPIQEYSKLLFWLRQTGGEKAVQAFEKLSESRKAFWLEKFCKWRYPRSIEGFSGPQIGKHLRETIIKEGEKISEEEAKKNREQFTQSNIKKAVKEISEEKQVSKETKTAQELAAKQGLDNLKKPELNDTNGMDTAANIGKTIVGGITSAASAVTSGAGKAVDYVSGYFSKAKTTAAESLAKNAYRVASSMGGTKSTGYCAKGVKTAMLKSGIIDMYPSGNAWQMSSLLSGNSNFQEITGQFSTKQSLAKAPRGSIIVWNKKTGVSKYGHIAVSLGNGKEASDHVRNTIVDNSNRYGGFRVFYPVAKGETESDASIMDTAWENLKSGYNSVSGTLSNAYDKFKKTDIYNNQLKPLAEKGESGFKTVSDKITEGLKNIDMEKVKTIGKDYWTKVKNYDYKKGALDLKDDVVAKLIDAGFTEEKALEYYKKLEEHSKPYFDKAKEKFNEFQQTELYQKGKEMFDNSIEAIQAKGNEIANGTFGLVDQIRQLLSGGVTDKLDKLVKLFEELKAVLEKAKDNIPLAITNVNNSVSNTSNNSNTVMNNSNKQAEMTGESNLIQVISE